MAIDKNTLKVWFETGKKPTEDQFAAWLDSYWHKSEKIAADNIFGLSQLLDQKADKELVNALTELIEAFDEEIQKLRNSVLFTAQNLTEEQKLQVQKNIGMDFEMKYPYQTYINGLNNLEDE